MSLAEYRALRAELAERDNDQGRAKFGNVKTVVDGITFHSRKEAKYYGQYKMIKLAGKLLSFEMQKPFNLDVNGEHIAIYKADFVLYYPCGRIEVVDVKSEATRVIQTYRIKKKLMHAIHGITIIEK